MVFWSCLLYSSFNMFSFQYDCFGEQVNTEFIWEGMNSPRLCRQPGVIVTGTDTSSLDLLKKSFPAVVSTHLIARGEH